MRAVMEGGMSHTWCEEQQVQAVKEAEQAADVQKHYKFKSITVV